ncbi:SDR family NAD(P)-dependent oxidoreductase [Terricaulis silvestris]|uniref:Short-chain type dehydrogenase/reductase n=1 Tax=Terricaulis silvestris TaxID=2686094 RepID=A0A6I6MNA1_9CAUL|nr:SDR family NAD(P)-dependent oxidoreductase [Terricaulis silvestris]QGZ96159.1 Putative short-chain type dehydrogenase/reductase [Terricaulis silvestris]
MIRFDNQVAIVTGAGGGMGRCYALELARRGARVVVNDYGGDMFGRDAGAAAVADAVVAEIRADGGDAIASNLPVGAADEARAIVAAAIEAYGRVDVLINNAGISASGALTAVSDERIENAYRTNVIGPHHLTRAVWPIMATQGYGRILNIASNAALGMGGSSAYAASKSGLIGLTFDAAKEGAALGIHVNALMPSAYSRMIEAVPDRTFIDWMREQLPAESVAAVAIYLVSSEARATGAVFSTGGGRLARVAWVEAEGVIERDVAPERVADLIDRASDMSGATLVDSQQAEIELYMRAFPMADGRVAKTLPASAFAKPRPESQ